MKRVVVSAEHDVGVAELSLRFARVRIALDGVPEIDRRRFVAAGRRIPIAPLDELARRLLSADARHRENHRRQQRETFRHHHSLHTRSRVGSSARANDTACSSAAADDLSMGTTMRTSAASVRCKRTLSMNRCSLLPHSLARCGRALDTSRERTLADPPCGRSYGARCRAFHLGARSSWWTEQRVPTRCRAGN